MDYAKRIGQVGALAVVLGVGAAVTTHAIGSAAPTDPSSSSTDSPVDACSPLGGSASSLAAIPGASVPQVGVRQVDPGSIPDDLLNALIDSGRGTQRVGAHHRKPHSGSESATSQRP